ncbi:MAG: hypothetical protein ABEK50_07840 [bacterium]
MNSIRRRLLTAILLLGLLGLGVPDALLAHVDEHYDDRSGFQEQ